MKFNDYEYKRPNKEEFVKNFDETLEKIAKAATPEEQIALVGEINDMNHNIQTMGSLCYIRNTQDKREEFYKAEQAFFDEFEPVVGEKNMQLAKTLLASPFKAELKAHYGDKAFKELELELKIISKETVPLMGEEAILANRYNDIAASAKIDFKGEVLNIAQLAKYRVDPDSAVRRAAYEAEAGFYAMHYEEVDQIFQDLVENRTKQAKALGFKSYTDFSYANFKRLGYGPQEVKVFRDNVVKHLVPVVNEIKKVQAKRIGKEEIFYSDDLYLFPESNPTPVGSPEHLMNQAIKMYSEMSPETKEFIEFMYEHELYDIVAREGKALGGYCTFMPDFSSPFIYSNFNGTAGDVDVLTHEAGHAFNAFVNRSEREFGQTHYGMEIAETHSMGMEFFADPWYGLFFDNDQKETDKYRLMHMEQSLSFIPYGCIVDEFQHYIYDNPGTSIDDKNKKWLELEAKYRPYLGFDNLPHYADGRGWQRQQHIYNSPFYYIDYCLAQTMAFRLYMLMDSDKPLAWEKYMYFVKNSGKRTFTELIADTKLASPFTNGSLEDLALFAKNWIEAKQ